MRVRSSALHLARILGLSLACATLPGYSVAALRHFGVEDGLPSLFISCVLQDHNETMWAASVVGGIARNDGLVWRSEPLPAELSEARINWLAEDRMGRVWLASDRGVAVRETDGAWTRLTSEQGLPSDAVTEIACDSSGTLWVVTDVGVARYDGTDWRAFSEADGLGIGEPEHLVVTSAGDVWVSASEWIARFDGTKWTRIDAAHGLPETPVTAIGTDIAGTLWIGIPSGVAAYEAGAWHVYGHDAGIVFDFITSITSARDGGIWIGYEGGMNYFGNRQSAGRILGAQGIEVRSVAEDRNGGVWFAVEGVFRWDRSERENIVLPPEIGGFVDVAVDSSGGIWIAGSGAAARWFGNEWTAFGADDGVIAENQGILVDREGAVWLGGYRGQVARYDGQAWRTFTSADGLLPQNSHTPVIAARDGSMWFVADTGLDRWHGSSWHTYTAQDGLASGSLSSAIEAHDGILWFASRSAGISRFDGSTWRTYTQAELPSTEVTCLVEDGQGAIWAGTPVGVARFDGTSWQEVAIEGVSDPYVLSAVVDSEGNPWFQMRGEIVRYRHGEWRFYGIRDGLSNDARIIQADRNGGVILTDDLTTFRITESGVRRFEPGEALSGIQEPAAQDRQDAFWFSARTGPSDVPVLGNYRLDHVSPQTVALTGPPRVHLAREASVSATVAWGERGLVQYSSRIGMRDPQRPLEDVNWSLWAEWSAVPVWTYRDLSDTTYVIEMLSRDIDGNVDPMPSRLAFEVDASPPVPVLRIPAVVSGDSAIIEGTVADRRYRRHDLEIVSVDGGSCVPGSLVSYESGAASGGPIGYWRTRTCSEGTYDMVLSVSDTLGLTGSTRQRVVVDNHAPFISQTSGAEIDPNTGGHIYTTNSEAHLYVPPHAMNGRVFITRAPADPDSVPLLLGNGAQRIHPGFDLLWPGGAAAKDLVLDVCYDAECYAGAAESSPGTQLAMYRVDTPQEVVRIGGSTDAANARLVVTIREPGRYALYADRVDEGSGEPLGALSLTPRVFSPAGRFANREVAIGFTLAHAGPVAVRVYNRAGRMIREVAGGSTLSAGRNVVRWDGRDRAGAMVADGLFIVSVEADGHKLTTALAVVR